MSEAFYLRLIDLIVPTITAIAALIVGIRALVTALHNKTELEIEKARLDGAAAGRAHRQRATDQLNEQRGYDDEVLVEAALEKRARKVSGGPGPGLDL